MKTIDVDKSGGIWVNAISAAGYITGAQLSDLVGRILRSKHFRPNADSPGSLIELEFSFNNAANGIDLQIDNHAELPQLSKALNSI